MTSILTLLSACGGFCRDEFEQHSPLKIRAFKELIIQELNRTDVTICHELVHSVPRRVRAVYSKLWRAY